MVKKQQSVQGRAWFFSPDNCALFVGRTGQEYTDSYELEAIPDWPTTGGNRLLLMGEDVVMRLIDPYTVPKGGTLQLTSGITIYYKEVH